jgi:cytochrome P450
MAKMQILLVMSAIVRKYDFQLVDTKDIGLHAMMLLKPDGPVNMKFTRIN